MQNVLPQLDEIAATIECKRGVFLLFFLLLRENKDTADLIISAKWADTQDKCQSLLNEVKSCFKDFESLKLPHIVVLEPDDPITKVLVSLPTLKVDKHRQFYFEDLYSHLKFKISKNYVLRKT